DRVGDCCHADRTNDPDSEAATGAAIALLDDLRAVRDETYAKLHVGDESRIAWVTETGNAYRVLSSVYGPGNRVCRRRRGTAALVAGGNAVIGEQVGAGERGEVAEKRRGHSTCQRAVRE